MGSKLRAFSILESWRVKYLYSLLAITDAFFWSRAEVLQYEESAIFLLIRKRIYYIVYTVSSRAISNNIAPQPRHFFILGLRPRTKCIGFGTILLDIALKHTVYPLHIYRKCPEKIRMGLKFWTSWGVVLTIFKINLPRRLF